VGLVGHDTEGLYRRLLDAWNRQDGDAMASCFDAEGEMIGFDGSQAQGPSEIAHHLKPIFADHETATFVAKSEASGN
jgi:uncharacterized protein (TIGR02246 family)